MELKTNLYDYQQAAVEKLRRLKVGALYMEMGTGKTRTALELIKLRIDKGRIKKALWLCPCSVKMNLELDLDKHADGWRDIITISGIESLSGSARLFSEHMSMVSQAATMLVVDESNLVKNSKAIRSRRIIAIAEKCPYRMILNGTPISKNEADLFGQWYLLDWRILGYQSFWTFAANHLEYDDYGRVRRTLNTDYLISKIAPYSYRVAREDCVKLPPKRYHTIDCWMTDDQQEHYDYAAEQMLFMVDEMQPSTIYRMFSALQAIISGRKVDAWTYKHMTSAPFFQSFDDNPRSAALDEAIDLTDGDKAIIFCKYTHEIDSIAAKLGSDAVTFYGGDSQRARRESLKRFEGSAKYLIANKACAGYGLNLQFCHNVIYYSNDWDYATRIQSEDRVYRIGQGCEVNIIDIVTGESLDQKIQSCLGRKESLVNEVKRELSKGNDVKATLRSWIRGGREKERINLGKDLCESECL